MTNPQHERTAPDRVKLSPGELLAIVSFWAFLAVLTAAGRLIDPRVPDASPAISSALVTLAFIQFTMWALLTAPIVQLASRVANMRKSPGGRVTILVVVGIGVAILVDTLLRSFWFRLLPLPPGRFRSSAWVNIARFEFLDDFMIYVAVVGAAFARDYYLRYRRHEDETRELESQLTEARLTALRTQINPHFLFNTLNAISTLVESDPGGVRRMVARLSDLLRHTLAEGQAPEVPITQELELLDRYLDIMKVRFQSGLDVVKEIDPAVRDALVPNMILQPLVENAFKHGLSGRVGDARVRIRGARMGDQVVLSVVDNGPGPTSAKTGVGLGNTLARLRQLYGEDQSFTLRSVSDGPESPSSSGAVAEIRLPYHTTPLIRLATDG